MASGMEPGMLMSEIDPETAHKAALNLAGIASERNDPCGLEVVLDALGLKELLRGD